MVAAKRATTHAFPSNTNYLFYFPLKQNITHSVTLNIHQKPLDLTYISPSLIFYAQALKWLASLLDRKGQWAACFVMQYVTWTIASTQRIESTHGAFSHWRRHSSSVTMLIANLEDRSARIHERSRAHSLRTALKHKTHYTLVSPRVKALREAVTPFAYSLMVAQDAQSGQYRCDGPGGINAPAPTGVWGPDTIWTVSRVARVPTSFWFQPDSDVAESKLAFDADVAHPEEAITSVLPPRISTTHTHSFRKPTPFKLKPTN
jgi:hypothetical protein